MSRSFREQLVGSWELIEYCAYLPDDETNKVYPMGPKAQGIIMYTWDGYMSAQLLKPGQAPFKQPGTKEDWEQVGRSYVAYTGEFYLNEQGDAHGPILKHHMRFASRPSLLGDTQRRLCKIVEESDGRYLVLGLLETMEIEGEDRVVRVRWRRLPDNSAKTKPS